MSESDLDDLVNEAGKSQEDDFSADWAAAFEEAGKTSPPPADKKPETVAFNSLSDKGAVRESDLKREDINLDVILDVPVTISMEIGRTRINIRNLLQLTQGSVVELDRLAGEPMDVLVNGTLIAHGEVVVVNDKFGIRLTDVLSPAERVKKLK